MSASNVVIRPRTRNHHNPTLGPLYGLLDVVVDGINLTARVGEGQIVSFLVELTRSVNRVLTTERRCATVTLQAEHEVWELGLEGDGSDVLLSVYCPGPVASVAAFERRIKSSELRSALLGAIQTAIVDEQAPLTQSERLGLRASEATLIASTPRHPTARVRRTVEQLSYGSKHLRLEARVAVRAQETSPGHSGIERADLHSLLTLGELHIANSCGGIVLASSQVFLDVECLLTAAAEALDSWRSARPTFRRVGLSGGRLNLRRGPGESQVELRISTGRAGTKVWVTNVETKTVVQTVAEFALLLAEKLICNDAAQRRNLRLTNLVDLAQSLLEQVAAHKGTESMSNPEPESYRRFVPKLRRCRGMWEQGSKMRFVPRWVATMPAIDLRATFLCGDRLLVGGASETACLDRQTGEVLWKQRLTPAPCVVTPKGLVRVEPDGRLVCHRLDNGEVRFQLRVQPRVAGGATGSVLSGPGLPQLLALSEGDRQVSGIDLTTGEVRWRYTATRPGAYRVRRAGRLLLIAGGDPRMVAVDGVTGEVVWSLRGRLPFSGDLTLDHQSGFAISGSLGGTWMLHRFDPFQGTEAWSVELNERPYGGRAPLLTDRAVIVPTFDQAGGGAVAFDRTTGQTLWEHAPGMLSDTSAWLAIDDCVLANSSSGVLMGLNDHDGTVRFNHVFSGGCDAEQPRRLEPVLRSGALFVPQQQVHVLRPRDGELLGTLPSDLIPDLLRVDERCDVYVAEESGHVAAFGAAPRLALVR